MIDTFLVMDRIKTEGEKTKKAGRGGARPGAGRKPTGSLKIQIRVSSEEMELIKKTAAENGIATAKFCKNAVMEKVR